MRSMVVRRVRRARRVRLKTKEQRLRLSSASAEKKK